ncbi:unnamed protein product [Cylicocyclus nassatus]|uniref:Uncharacterized protein n=1 Tax=Cylicocyclus nassatus TaxID=53992 RepID=A0AA36M6N3_CYLNA|nr:unnamed protein product [Cylicocyclus nassatus]
MEETTDMDRGDTSDEINEEEFDDLSVTIEELVWDMQRLQELQPNAEDEGVIVNSASSGDSQEVH